MISPELMAKLQQLKNESGSYALNKSIPIATICSPPFSNIRELILCDAGVHSSSKLAGDLIERHEIPAVSLRGGLWVIENMLKSDERSEIQWINMFISNFAHIVVMRTKEHCTSYYGGTTDQIIYVNPNVTFHSNETSALIEIVSRYQTLKR